MWPIIDGLRTLDLGFPGEMRARLNSLVLSGSKRATAGLVEDYRADGEEIEHVGERLVLIDGEERRVAEVEVTAVAVVPFAAVDREFARAEGEGYRSLEHWREVHRAFWADEGYTVGPDTEVVCVHFRLLP